MSASSSRSARWAELARGWYLLGQPIATSSLVAWVYAPFGFVVALTLDRALFGGSVLIWLAIAGLGQLVVVAALPTLGWALHRFVPQRAWSLGVVLVMTLVVCLRGIVMDGAAAQVGLSSVAGITHWLVSDVITQLIFLIIIGYRVSSRRDHEALQEELDRERRELTALETAMSERLADIDQRLSIQMGLTIEPRLRALDAVLGDVERGADPAPLVDSLRMLVDDEIRPLSHRLAEPVFVPAVDTVPVAEGPMGRLSLPSRIALSEVFRPLLVSGIVGLFAFGQIERLSTLSDALTFAPLLAALIWLLLTVFRRAVTRVRVRLWIGVFLAIVVSSLAVALSSWIVIALGSAGPTGSFVRAAIGGAVLGALSALAAVVDAHQTRCEMWLREQIVEREETISISKQRMWVTRRRLGYALHGSVQAALHVAAIRLSSREADNPAVVEGIRADIASALDRLRPRNAEPIDVMQACDDLAETWRGTCEVVCEVSPAARAAFDSSSTAAECAIEVLVEAVQNSIRHGGATRVAVMVDLSIDRLVLNVIDNGRWVDGDAGLGSRMMDELCTTWVRQPLESGTQLGAELMVS